MSVTNLVNVSWYYLPRFFDGNQNSQREEQLAQIMIRVPPKKSRKAAYGAALIDTVRAPTNSKASLNMTTLPTPTGPYEESLLRYRNSRRSSSCQGN